MKKHKHLLFACLLVLFSGVIASAQVNTGAISGTVKDSAGAVVAGARVEVLNEGTGISRTIDTDSDGRFLAPSLNLGNYRVTVTKDGFQTEVRKGLVLTVGVEMKLDLSLAIGSMTQTVEVTGEAPLVEATSASLGSLVDDTTIRALPLNGRSYDQLALLQPGVVLTSPGPPSGSIFSAGAGKRFSVGGERPDSNLFLLDGTNVNDQANGTPGGAAGTNLGVDTILEFKIFTNSFKAEYGHSSGSVISAVTRSGTNDIHGTAFEYFRNSAMDARNFFDQGTSPPSFRRNQFGGVLGGPIKKDKTFFFGGYEGLRQGLDLTQIAIVPQQASRAGAVAAVVPYLNLYPLPSPNAPLFSDGTGEFISAPPNITNEDNFMVRVDHQLNSKTSLFARYTFDRDNVNAPSSIPTFFTVSNSRRQYTTLQANTILGPKALNSFRFAYNRTFQFFNQPTIPDPGLSFVPGQPFGAIALGGVTSGNVTRAITPLGSTNGNGANLYVFNVFEWGDDFTFVKGKHAFKVGADIQRVRDNTANPGFLRGDYTFTSFTTFLAGTPSNFQVGSPLGVAPYWGFRQTETGFYGQDDYTVNSRLTLNLGLRWDATTDPYDVNGANAVLPAITATSLTLSNNYFTIGKKNFEPRIGLAWQLDKSGKTVLRAGAGIYHDQILPFAYQVQARVPPFYGTYSLKPPPPLPFPNAVSLITGSTGGLIALNVMAPTQKDPTNDQFNLSIQRELFKNTMLQISYAGDRADHLLTQEEADGAPAIICSTTLANCPAGIANGTEYFSSTTRVNTAWAGMRYNQTSIGHSNYNSGTILFRTQTSHGIVGQVYYTYSKALDNASNTVSSSSVRSPSALLDANNPDRDYGLSEFNATNAAVFNFSYPIPVHVESKGLGAAVNGWTFNGIGTFSSGLPFTARLATSVSKNLSTSLADRPDLNAGFSSNPTHGISAGCPGFAPGTPVGNANNWYDPCAFSLPITGTYGNLGRNTIIGPGLEDIDFALEKSFKPTERVNLTFRAEMFNVLNHANFGLPATNPLASTGATISINPLVTTGVANPSAGVITYTVTSSRQIQLALRASF